MKKASNKDSSSHQSLSSSFLSNQSPPVQQSETGPQFRVKATHLFHVVKNCWQRKKQGAMEKIKLQAKEACLLEKRILKFETVINAFNKKRKKQFLAKLKANKRKFDVKVDGCSLLHNSVKRINERKKSQFFAIAKSSTVKFLKAERNSMLADNEKYKENILTDIFIKEMKKLTKLNPQYNLSSFLQTVQQTILPLLSRELMEAQGRRKKKSQASDNEFVLMVMNSLSICLVNTSRTNKTLNEELKSAKESLGSLKQFISLKEQFDKMDKELMNKGESQVRKVIENQMKACLKKKGSHSFYESRYNLLEMISRNSPTQKFDKNKQLSQKLQILNEVSYNPSEMQTFRESLKPASSLEEKQIYNLSTTILALQKGGHEMKKQEEKGQVDLNDEVGNLSKILQRIIQGKLFQSGKKSGWKNFFKNAQKQKDTVVESMYENVGKLLQIIEAKDSKISELMIEVEKTEKILDDLVRLMNDQENEELKRDWKEIQQQNMEKKEMFIKINEHLEHYAALSDKEYPHSARMPSVDSAVGEQTEIKELNSMLEEQEGKLIDLEKQNAELKDKETIMMNLKQVLMEEEERVKDLSEEIESLRRRDEERGRKMEEARQQLRRFQNEFRTHQRELSERRKQVSSIMKSPKNASFSKHNFFRYEPQNVGNGENQTTDFQHQLVKETNRQLESEIQKLQQQIQSSINLDNTINLIYNIVSISFGIPNEAREAEELWKNLSFLKIQYQYKNPTEALVKTQKVVAEWIKNNLLYSLEEEVNSKTIQMNQLLKQINMLSNPEKQDPELTPKKRSMGLELTDAPTVRGFK